MSKKMQGNIALFLAALIWGSAFVAQSKGMEHVGPLTYNGVRTLVGFLVLIPVVYLLNRSRRGTLSPADKKTLNKNTMIGGLCCGLVLFVASTLQQFGIQYTTAGKAGFITALYIVMVPVAGLLFKRRVRWIIWVCVAAAIAGFWLLCIKEDLTLGRGDLLVLLCAVFFTGHILVIDHFSPRVDCVKMSCIQFFVCGILSLIGAFIFEEPTVPSILDAKWTILYAGVLSSGVAYTLQIVGQKVTEPTVATLLMSLESVFAALAGWLILKEHFSPKEFIGCVLVFAAVILAQIPLPQRKKES